MNPKNFKTLVLAQEWSKVTSLGISREDFEKASCAFSFRLRSSVERNAWDTLFVKGWFMRRRNEYRRAHMHAQARNVTYSRSRQAGTRVHIATAKADRCARMRMTSSHDRNTFYGADVKEHRERAVPRKTPTRVDEKRENSDGSSRRATFRREIGRRARRTRIKVKW